MHVDVADPTSAASAVEGVGELGGLDILVNMAGVDPEAKAEEFDDARLAGVSGREPVRRVLALPGGRPRR